MRLTQDNTDKTFSAKGQKFYIREEVEGDIAVIEEVFLGDIYNLTKRNKKRPKTIVDIGGHIGTFSVLAKTLWRKARIIHLEPSIRSHELARKNLEPFKNVECLYGAMMYDKEATALVDDTRSTGGCTMRSEQWCEEHLDEERLKEFADRGIDITYYKRYVGTPLYTLEDIIDKYALQYIDILKLDCEGAENDFFAGAKPETFSKIGDYVGEFHGSMSDFYLSMRKVMMDNVYKISFAGQQDDIGIFWAERF